jgi:hypothetical protein
MLSEVMQFNVDMLHMRMPLGKTNEFTTSRVVAKELVGHLCFRRSTVNTKRWDFLENVHDVYVLGLGGRKCGLTLHLASPYDGACQIGKNLTWARFCSHWLIDGNHCV